MTDDEIEQGLAAHGVPLFAFRPPAGTPRPDPAALMQACLESGVSRYKVAIIPLLLTLPHPTALAALASVRARVSGKSARWLRWLVLAADYLTRVYRSELAFLLGRLPEVPVDPADRGGLPQPSALDGELGLRALAEEVAAVEGPEVDWEGTLEQPAQELIEHLWFERRRERAKAG